MGGPPERARTDEDEAIMRATYRALRNHGYADLTMKRIAEEYGKSTAAIHYHYDTKDDLLGTFLEYVLDRFKSDIHEVEITDPGRRLEMLLDRLLVKPEDHRNLLIAMLEMRSQAPYNDTFQDRFQQNDEYVRYLLETVIEQGVEAGVYREVDATRVARGLMMIVDGARTREVVLEEPHALEEARQIADEYLDAVLYTDEGRGAVRSG